MCVANNFLEKNFMKTLICVLACVLLSACDPHVSVQLAQPDGGSGSHDGASGSGGAYGEGGAAGSSGQSGAAGQGGK